MEEGRQGERKFFKTERKWEWKQDGIVVLVRYVPWISFFFSFLKSFSSREEERYKEWKEEEKRESESDSFSQPRLITSSSPSGQQYSQDNIIYPSIHSSNPWISFDIKFFFVFTSYVHSKFRFQMSSNITRIFIIVTFLTFYINVHDARIQSLPKISASELRDIIDQASLNIKRRLEIVEPSILASGMF